MKKNASSHAGSFKICRGGSVSTPAASASPVIRDGITGTLSTGGLAAPDTVRARPVPKWQRERARKLQQICLAIDARRARGITLHKAVTRPAWNYRQPRFYRSEPTRRVRLSRVSITNHYYRWLKAGKSADAFALRYRSGREKLIPAKVRAYIRAAITSPARSFRETLVKAGDTATFEAYRHALPIRFRKLLAALFRERRQVERTCRIIRRALKGAKI